MMNKGRVCVKIAGRDTGICAVIDKDKKKQKVLVAGPKVRKRWVLPAHLEPLSKTLDPKLTEAKLMKELEKISREFEQVRLDPLDVLAIKARSRK